MKLSRLEKTTLLLAAVCVAFMAGWYVRGGAGAGPVRIDHARTPPAPDPSSPEGTEASPEETAGLPPAAGEDPNSFAAWVEGGTESAAEEKVNLNTADQAALESLPGIGQKRAADIIAYREANGPFQSVSDMTQIPGIGAQTLERLRDLVTI